MLQFSTHELRPQDRFDHWCEVRGKSLFGVTIELPKEKRTSFQGRFSAVSAGGAVVSHMQASSYRVSRTMADIVRMPGNSILVGLQVRGPGRVKLAGEADLHVKEGGFILSHSEAPFTAIPDGDGGFDYRTIKISLADDLLLGAKVHDFSAALPKLEERFVRPFAALFDKLTRQPSDLADHAHEIAHMARLTLLARGRLAAGVPEVRAALRSGFLEAARRILARDLHIASLSPEMVARELAISLRLLHALFEPTGQSFARTLTAMRLKKACQLLQSDGLRPVIQIAYTCGFDSIATFYRVFRGAFGVAPGDWRAMRNRA